MSITLDLDLTSANDIVAVLGHLPTSSGAFPLMMNIKSQIESQTNKTLPEDMPLLPEMDLK